MEKHIEILQQKLLNVQDKIISMAEQEDGFGKFIIEDWSSKLGNGKTAVLESGNIFEKAGVNFSMVSGRNLPKSASASRPELAGANFKALGVSVVLHPANPYVPTSHFNVRFFSAKQPNGKYTWWYGGGFDLTPYYGFEEDCIYWHTTAKETCDKFDKSLYPKFKNWCDEYFYLKHRKEPRGIGGLFFDDLDELGLENGMKFILAVSDAYIKAYQHVVNRRKNTTYTAKEKEFQLYRRGRYVEFNLVYDRGTIFGLQSDGRTESILMSLPPEVNWKYNWQPEPGSKEAELYNEFLVKKEWVNL